MELTTSYILSQFFSTIGYILLGSTFFLKNRRTILIVGFINSIFLIIGYWFLNKYQGMAMVTVGILANIIFFIDEQKNGKTDIIARKDIIMLIILLTYTAILTAITYTDLLSLFSVLGTIAWLISVWIKDVKKYKVIAIFTAIFWLVFNIYALSISGIITEIILIIASICGLVLHIKSENKNTENLEEKKVEV